jgi:osmotically-inducible protein OsmY
MKTTFNKLVVLGALAGTAASLSGCFPLAAGGALMTGFVVTDRRTSGALVEDQGIELKATNRIRDTLGEKVHVNVASYNRKVLLTGEAPNPQDKEKVADLVREIENVTTTWNEIGVLPITSLSERSSDIIISGRIKAELLDTKDLMSNAF